MRTLFHLIFSIIVACLVGTIVPVFMFWLGHDVPLMQVAAWGVEGWVEVFGLLD